MQPLSLRRCFLEVPVGLARVSFPLVELGGRLRPCRLRPSGPEPGLAKHDASLVLTFGSDSTYLVKFIRAFAVRDALSLPDAK